MGELKEMNINLSKLYQMLWYFSIWTHLQLYIYVYETPLNMRVYDIKRILCSLCICSVGGYYNAYVYPRQIYIPYLDYECKGNVIKVMDFIGHHLPLLYFYFSHVRPNHEQLSLYNSFTVDIIALPIIYISCMPVEKLYGIKARELLMLSPFVGILYMVMLYF